MAIRAICKQPAKDCASMCAFCEESAATELATLRARVEELERLARMVVDGQLTETEHERGIYRRGFRALLDAARASAGERGE